MHRPKLQRGTSYYNDIFLAWAKGPRLAYVAKTVNGLRSSNRVANGEQGIGKKKRCCGQSQ